MVIGRFAGTIFTSEPSFTATVVLVKVGMKWPTGSFKPDLAFFHQRENCRAGDGFGLRGDAEDGVRRHLPPGFLVAPAHSALVHGLAVAKHQSDRSGNLVLLYIILKKMVDAS